MKRVKVDYNPQLVYPLYRILKKFDVERESINPGLRYRNDLGFDEDDWNIFLLYLEQRYGIRISSKAEKKLTTISKTLDYLTEHAEIN